MKLKHIFRWMTILVIFAIVLFGGWCLPPQMRERLLENLRAKHAIEQVVKLQDDDLSI
ncbi:MAG: hypothetical protein H6695_16480 [Deferribacteres bacterium]|nr:hypothetical protein [candidate division KSB1 bacterium]MCB9511785.1 hypothetical protein [Deferribacteres bacterium]